MVRDKADKEICVFFGQFQEELALRGVGSSVQKLGRFGSRRCMPFTAPIKREEAA